MPDCLIDYRKLEDYEAGAILVTWLAYPGKKDRDEARAALHQSLCALTLRAQAEADPAWANAPQAMKPIYALRAQRQIDKDLKSLRRRLRDRMIAAKMAIAYLKEVPIGELPLLPDGIKSLSLNQLSEMVLEEASQSDPVNVESRIWRPSLPVIHLAAATQLFMSEAKRLGHRPITVVDLIYHRVVTERILADAETCKALLLANPRLKIDPDILVNIRLR